MLPIFVLFAQPPQPANASDYAPHTTTELLKGVNHPAIPYKVPKHGCYMINAYLPTHVSIVTVLLTRIRGIKHFCVCSVRSPCPHAPCITVITVTPRIFAPRKKKAAETRSLKHIRRYFLSNYTPSPIGNASAHTPPLSLLRILSFRICLSPTFSSNLNSPPLYLLHNITSKHLSKRKAQRYEHHGRSDLPEVGIRVLYTRELGEIHSKVTVGVLAMVYIERESCWLEKKKAREPIGYRGMDGLV